MAIGLCGSPASSLLLPGDYGETANKSPTAGNRFTGISAVSSLLGGAQKAKSYKGFL